MHQDRVWRVRASVGWVRRTGSFYGIWGESRSLFRALGRPGEAEGGFWPPGAVRAARPIIRSHGYQKSTKTDPPWANWVRTCLSSSWRRGTNCPHAAAHGRGHTAAAPVSAGDAGLRGGGQRPRGGVFRVRRIRARRRRPCKSRVPAINEAMRRLPHGIPQRAAAR